MKHSQEHLDIITETGADISACACSKCQSMCLHTPCIGTPQDILNIINAGYIEFLAPTIWAAGLSTGIPLIEMVQLKSTGNTHDGRCVMHTKDGLCKLHSQGLKPIEGKITTNHFADSYRLQIIERRPSVAVTVANTWLKKANAPTIKLINLALQKFKRNENKTHGVVHCLG